MTSHSGVGEKYAGTPALIGAVVVVTEVVTFVVGARVAGIVDVAGVVPVTGGAAADVSDGLGDDDEHDATTTTKADTTATTTATVMRAPRAGKRVVIVPI